jgi:hypothetical protein
MMCYPHWKALIGLVCLLVGPVSLASAQTSASTDIIVRLADGAADLRSSLEQPST